MPLSLLTSTAPGKKAPGGRSVGATAFARMKHSLASCAMLLMSSMAYAGLGSLLGLGGDSGQLAKLEFRLRDNFPVTSVAWSPDGRYIATASTQRNLIHIWDAQQRQLIHEITLAASQTFFHGLSWSPDGRYLTSCGGESSLRIYDSRNWTLARQIGGFREGICAQNAVFSSDGSQLAVLGSKLRFYDTQDWHLVKTLDLGNTWGRGYLINAIAYIPGTHTLLIGGGRFQSTNTPAGYQDRNTGYVWFLEPDDAVPGRSLQVYGPETVNGGSGAAISLAMSPDGTQLATGARTGDGYAPEQARESVHIFSLPKGELLGMPLDGLEFGRQHGLIYTADGRYLVVGHADAQTKAIHVIDAKTSKVVDQVHGIDAVYDLTADPTGRYFAAGTGNQVLVWSLPPPAGSPSDPVQKQ